MLNQVDASVAAQRTIVLCVLAALCEGIDLQAAGVAAGGLSAEFHPTPDQLGDFFSASTFGLFIGALLGGWMADKVGRKGVLVTSIALFGLFSLLTSLAWDIHSLVYMRLLTGLGLGGAFPNLIALVSESSRENRRHANVALAYSGNPFGGALISLVTLLLASTHWRGIFIVGGVLPLLLAPIMAFTLQESTEFREAARASDAGPGRGNLFAVLQDGRALGTILLWISFFLGLLTLYLLLNWLPILLQGDGFTRPEAAAAQIGFNVGGALAALLIGALLEGSRRGLSIVVTFVALPILLVALAHSPAQLAIVISVVCLLGCAVLAAQAFLYSMAPSLYPTTIRGIGVGAAVAIGRIGSVVGPKLGGMLKAAGHGYQQLLMDLLPIVIAASVCARALAWHRPGRARR
jgi:MFS transporter, AAHS family, 3-hydroxyphenylpropionic acid transporter